jgi:hypothetical protein
MTRAIAAALVLAASALLVPGSAIAQAAPDPNPLWSEFPLQPLVETVPTSSTPAPPAREQPVPENQTVGENDRTAGFLILVGAAMAAGVGFVGRRRFGRRQQPQGEVQPEPERAAVHTFERPVPAGGSGGATGSVAVATRSRTRAVMPGTLIETLSPQARLADELQGAESETELETHEVCEIACWRGYVTWQFYVELDPPREALSSPYFRAPGKGAPEQTEPALAAHAVLVEKLVAAGWEPEGYGEEWFSERFQRATPSA